GSPGPTTLFGGEGAPIGVAIDPATNRIFWDTATAIRVAALDGSQPPANLFSGNQANPQGVAIDPAANRIYWANNGTGTIRVGGLDGSLAPANLFSGESNPNFVALLRSSVGAGAPAVSGAGHAGEALSCSQGTWAPDLPGAQLYRAPRSFAYEWLLNGAQIGGAAGSSYTPHAVGSYSCRVTATNQAGSTAQTSAALEVRENARCKRLRKKHKRQKRGLARATTPKKRSHIQANIRDTKRRSKRLGCR